MCKERPKGNRPTKDRGSFMSACTKCSTRNNSYISQRRQRQCQTTLRPRHFCLLVITNGGRMCTHARWRHCEMSLLVFGSSIFTFRALYSVFKNLANFRRLYSSKLHGRSSIIFGSKMRNSFKNHMHVLHFRRIFFFSKEICVLYCAYLIVYFSRFCTASTRFGSKM